MNKLLKIYVLVAIYISCKMSISKEFGQTKQQQEILRLMWNAQTAVIVGIAWTQPALNWYQSQDVMTMSNGYAQNHARRVKMVGWIDV